METEGRTKAAVRWLPSILTVADPASGALLRFPNHKEFLLNAGAANRLERTIKLG